MELAAHIPGGPLARSSWPPSPTRPTLQSTRSATPDRSNERLPAVPNPKYFYGVTMRLSTHGQAGFNEQGREAGTKRGPKRLKTLGCGGKTELGLARR